MTSSPDECAGGDCGDVLDKLEAFLDGELPETSVTDLSAHLADCYPCADRRDFEAQLRAIVKQRCAGEVAPEGLLDKIRARIAATTSD